MAMLSGGQASVLSGGKSAFGQFRLTTFIDSTPKVSRTAAASPVSRIATSTEGIRPDSQRGEDTLALSSPQDLASFANALQSSSQAFTPNPSHPASTTTQSAAPASASHNGFGILDVGSAGSPGSYSSPHAREGKLGPHRDGRVRNPVPSKLKGRTDEKNGEFSVMHIDISGSGGPNDIPRGEAAQRTSENTAQAARAAINNDGFKGVKRRRVEALMHSQRVENGRPAQPPPTFSTFSQHQQEQHQERHQQEAAHRNRVLTPEETKYEQARLLTLLRSITPLTVVDQICKALAFFGGIPGAPPPENGSFPESADANGSGMLFVGWLSEIFPELERKTWRPDNPRPQEVKYGPRPRGRPKGSKASKVRKDKGIKKGPKHPNKIDGLGVKSSTVTHTNEASGDSAEAEDLDEEWVDITDLDPPVERNDNPTKRGQQRSPLDQTPSITNTRTPDVGSDQLSFINSNQDFSSELTSSGRRRPGRPRGSRNKQRDLQQGGSPSFTVINHADQHTPEVSVTPELQRRQVGPPTSTPVKQISNASSQQSPQISTKRRRGQGSTETDIPLPQPGQIPGLSTEEQAVIEAFRTAQAAKPISKPAAANEKAKRSRPRTGARVADEAPAITAAILPPDATDNMPSARGIGTSQGPPAVQPAHKDSGPILPPPKRQRKAKDPSTASAKKASLTSDTSSSAPVPDPVAPAAVPNVRPPAQGLEAHYERFANLQHQGDQQHQQTRHELNPATRSSPMQSASAYFHQPRLVSSTFDQQYPSHQASNPYQPGLIPQTDSFRTTNQQHRNFSNQQQQSSHQFDQFSSSSFIDVPALDSVTSGTTNVDAYGQSMPRSTSNANFGTGGQIGSGFDGMGEVNLGERLLRGIGRR